MTRLLDALQTLAELPTSNPGGMIGIFIGVILLLGLIALFKVIGDGFGNPAWSTLPKGFPYERAEFLSPAERSFLGALELALGPRYRIFAKVRLADVIKTRSELDGRRRQGAFNQIIQKHLDFVLCDPASLAVVAVVELDDSSHRKARQRERDQWKDEALKAASIPVVRFPAARSYATTELAEGIAACLGAGSVLPPPIPSAAPPWPA